MTNNLNIAATLNTKAPKIHTSNRILLKGGKVIYVSGEIIAALVAQKIITRVEQRHAPLKGCYPQLVADLKQMAKAKPNHFAKSALLIIETLTA